MSNSHTEIARRLGEIVAMRREQRGLTQERVAELLGIGIQAISRIERGAVMPTLQRLFELADLYQCGIEDLLVASSSRNTDLSLAIAGDIEPLSSRDRQLVANVLKVLIAHLTQPSG